MKLIRDVSLKCTLPPRRTHRHKIRPILGVVIMRRRKTGLLSTAPDLSGYTRAARPIPVHPG